jgi:hypothetical protein
MGYFCPIAKAAALRPTSDTSKRVCGIPTLRARDGDNGQRLSASVDLEPPVSDGSAITRLKHHRSESVVPIWQF